MIIILSGDSEVSTDFVCEYLHSLNYPYKRINSYDLINKKFNISINDNTFIIGDDIINIDNVGVVWYRKFGFFYKSQQYKDLETSFNTTFANNISKEFTSLLETITSIFKHKEWLTNPSAIGVNKIEMLNVAKELGLDIPNTFVINTKNDLEDIYHKNEIISKSIRDPWVISRDEKFTNIGHTMFTSIIEEEDIEITPNLFFPSLVQEKIEKDYEIRTFYLEGNFYSMAIFSQLDPQTAIDFRQYNWKKPNRSVPYILPSNIENKLKKLVKYFNLNCCSIDIIKGKNDKYYFLEINPTGQFGMVDFPCNYNLHEKIANFLIRKDKKYHEKNKILQKNKK